MSNSENWLTWPDLSQRIREAARLEICRRRFWDFCEYYDPDFFTSRPFLEAIAGAMQRVFDRQIMRLSISLPPRSGKSYLGSLFCAWVMGKRPEGSIMRNACTATLYNKFSYDVRAIVLSDKYQAVFSIALASDKQNLQGWNTTQARQVSYFGAGVGGTIIGFGATELAMTDDLFRSFEDATSERVVESTHSWYRGNHVSRMEKECPSIDIGTRWSKADIIGTNIETGYYDESIVIAALTPEGKSFCEAVKTTDEYLDIQDRTPLEIWEGEYMQNPIESSGTLFPEAELQRFSLVALRERLDQRDANGSPILEPDGKLAYIDVADEGDDYLAMAVGVIIGAEVFITDVVFTDRKIDVSMGACVDLVQRMDPDYIRIEANNQGRDFINQFAQYITRDKLLAVTNSQNKHSRILAQYGFVKHYFRFVSREEITRSSDYDRFMKNLCGYIKAGTSRHDDAPDCTSGLAKFCKSMHGHLFHVEPQEN